MPPVLRSHTKNAGVSLREPNNTNAKKKRRIVSTHPYQLRSSALPPLKSEEVAERSSIAMHASNSPVAATATTTHEGRSTVHQALARLDEVVEKGLAAIRREMTALRVDAIALHNIQQARGGRNHGFLPVPFVNGYYPSDTPYCLSPLTSDAAIDALTVEQRRTYLHNYGILTYEEADWCTARLFWRNTFSRTRLDRSSV
ncbi:hypothetical protein BD626DRAFT_513505 [Schizophyllum amplum]|uniref:Mug135-like C-terminal domain-containing protein n=1 Tax=Schizophyllum amplum TaxID=97359 RepID=A0A550BZ03_9AGAR|nr:hypothetical protein BD626DRAFT_513505 [Auriculariopsis ampla]